MSKKEKDLTESKLVELGFEKTDVSPEEAGDDKGFYYFTYELYNSNCLISDTNDDADKNNGQYEVRIFNMWDAGVFDNETDVMNLLTAIKAGKRGDL